MYKRFYMIREAATETGGEAGGSAGTMAGGQGGSSTGEAGTRDQNQGSGTSGSQESGTQDSNDTGEFNFDSLDEKTQSYIKGLRAENADFRTKSNNLMTRMEKMESGLKSMFGEEDQESTPEQQLEQLTGAHEQATYNNAIMSLAYENGVPQESFEYFSFLMEKAVDGLEEGQELSEENLVEIMTKAKASQGFSQKDTSVDDDSKGSPEGGNTGGVTLEEFSKMDMVRKSELYRKSPDVYNSLMAQAREKKLL